MNKLTRHLAMIVEIVRLPVAGLSFHSRIDPERIPEAYRYHTKPHPKYRVIQNKSVGAALIDLKTVVSRDEYLDRIKAKNFGGHHARRARARGYSVAEINRNEFIDEIHAINTSVETRQGRPMENTYLQKIEQFETLPNFKYFGLLDAKGTLMAYADIAFYGNFCAFSRVLGRRNNDGIMHLLVVDIVCGLIDEGKLDYVMYDTFFGALPGLRQFKEIVGFTPYRARYSMA